MVEEESSPPDPPEAQAIDSLFLAVADGDGGGAAAALRRVGKLSGFPLSFLADILDPAAVHGSEPWRVRLKKLTKGRPRRLKPKLATGTISPFVHYLSTGDAKKAAQALRSRKKVSGSELALLADLFDQNVGLPEGISFRLELASNRSGRPVNKLERSVSDFYWKRIYAAAFKENPENLNEAIQEVLVILEKRNKKSLAMGKKPKPLPSYSTIRNGLKRLGFLSLKMQK